MTFRFFVLAAIAATLAACGPSPATVSPPAGLPSGSGAGPVVGLLEVRISGIGGASAPTATARFLHPGVGGQATTVVSDTGLTFSRQLVSFYDDEATSTRYITSVFDITNTTALTFNNLTLYAVSVPGTTIGGTAVASMFDAAGNSITSSGIAQGMKPTHGMRPTNTALVVDPDLADLQLFSTGEAAAAQSQAAAISPPISGDVLEYGFVARNTQGGRTIAAGSGGVCSVPACKGVVALAYRFPKVSPRVANPFAFSLYFVVADESTTRATQSPEEQTDTAGVTARATAVGASEVAFVAGSRYTAENGNNLCRPRTAGSAASPLAFLVPAVSTASGAPDACFAASGKAITAFGTDTDQARALAVQTDGNIVAAGFVWNGSNSDFALFRYLPNGSLDTSFDFDGKATIDYGSDEDAYAVAIQADGKIVVAGYAFTGSNLDIALVRYNTDGSLDGSFGTGGRVTTAVGFGNDRAYAVTIQADGKIVVAGEAYNGSNDDFALVRYNTDGSLDGSFGTGGKVTTAVGSDNDFAYAVAIQADGKIVVAGTSLIGSTADFVLVRYTTDGSLDPTFGTGGKVTTAIGTGNDLAYAVAVQSDQKIVVAGYALIGSTADFALARYTTTGSLDLSFGTGGKVTTSLGNDDVANTVAVQSDGKIVAAGYTRAGSSADFALARYTTSGSLDATFDTDGKVTTDLGNYDVANAVAVQANGKIVLAGYSAIGFDQEFALARYQP